MDVIVFIFIVKWFLFSFLYKEKCTILGLNKLWFCGIIYQFSNEWQLFFCIVCFCMYVVTTFKLRDSKRILQIKILPLSTCSTMSVGSIEHLSGYTRWKNKNINYLILKNQFYIIIRQWRGTFIRNSRLGLYFWFKISFNFHLMTMRGSL